MVSCSDNGTIEDKEFLAHIDERPSFFTLEIFRFIDENSDGIMSFAEFIHASMKFGLLTQNGILECMCSWFWYDMLVGGAVCAPALRITDNNTRSLTVCFNIFLRGRGSRIEGVCKTMRLSRITIRKLIFFPRVQHQLRELVETMHRTTEEHKRKFLTEKWSQHLWFLSVVRR